MLTVLAGIRLRSRQWAAPYDVQVISPGVSLDFMGCIRLTDESSEQPGQEELELDVSVCTFECFFHDQHSIR